MLFHGPKGEANWEAMLKGFGHANAKRTPVPGLGAPAEKALEPTVELVKIVLARLR
jgi:hypothetical protein